MFQPFMPEKRQSSPVDIGEHLKPPLAVVGKWATFERAAQQIQY